MQETDRLVFTGSRKHILKFVLIFLLLAAVTFLVTMPDVAACARREPCDLSSCLAFLCGLGMVYGAAYIYVVSRRPPGRLELSPHEITLPRNGKIFTFRWQDVTAVSRASKLTYLDCRSGGKTSRFTISPTYLSQPEGCDAALQDHIARYFTPASVPAARPRPVLNIVIVLALEYGILFTGAVLLLLLTAALKAATGAPPKDAINLLNILCVVIALQAGMALKRRNWRPGRFALIAGTLLYLLICLLGLSALPLPSLTLAIMQVLGVPFGLLFGLLRGRKRQATAVT